MQHDHKFTKSAASTHDASFDLIRVVACLAVVLLHVSARPIYLHIQGGASYGWWLIANAISSLTHWCVPVFVMLSGALLLGRDLTWRDVYLRRLPRMVAALAVACAIYAAWRIWFLKDFTVPSFVQDLISGQPYYHLYFFYVVIGLYAVSPILAKVFAQVDQKTARAIPVAACVITFITFTVGTYRGTYSPNAVSFSWDYLGYFTLGFYLARYRPALPYVVITAVAYIATVLGTEALYRIFGVKWPWLMYFYLYFSPTVFLFSLGVFGLLMNIRPSGRISNILAFLAPLTLLVYIIHPMIMEFLRWFFAAHVPELVKLKYDLPLTYSLTVGLAFGAAYVLRQIPAVRRYL